MTLLLNAVLKPSRTIFKGMKQVEVLMKIWAGQYRIVARCVCRTLLLKM